MEKGFNFLRKNFAKGVPRFGSAVFCALLALAAIPARADIASTTYVQGAVERIVQALNQKADLTALAPVATSGSYNDLTDKPNAAVLGADGKIVPAQLPVGAASGTIAAGDDSRFLTIPTSQPPGTPPAGQVFLWFE